jgi:hypothetical protein
MEFNSTIIFYVPEYKEFKKISYENLISFNNRAIIRLTNTEFANKYYYTRKFKIQFLLN